MAGRNLAPLINSYRQAIGHDAVNFRDKRCAARVNLNDLTVVRDQLRERAEHILIGRGDHFARLALSSIK